MQEIRQGRHCVFLLHTHLVFVTKYRKNIFNQKYLNKLKEIFDKVCNDFDVTLVSCQGEADHVHLLVNYSPQVTLSKLVNSLKGVSSRLLRKEYPEISKYYFKKALWSPSYFAGSCGGAPLETVKQYVEAQQQPKN